MTDRHTKCRSLDIDEHCRTNSVDLSMSMNIIQHFHLDTTLWERQYPSSRSTIQTDIAVNLKKPYISHAKTDCHLLSIFASMFDMSEDKKHTCCLIMSLHSVELSSTAEHSLEMCLHHFFFFSFSLSCSLMTLTCFSSASFASLNNCCLSEEWARFFFRACVQKEDNTKHMVST